MAFRHDSESIARPVTWTERCVPVAMLAVALFVSSACATIRHPRAQSVRVHSVPSGADVFIGERHAGVTPVAISPNRRARNIVVRLEKDGFAPAELPLRRSPSRGLLGDLVFPAVISAVAGQAASRAEMAHVFAGTLAFTLGIDFLTGAAFRYPANVGARLPEGMSTERTGRSGGRRLGVAHAAAAQDVRRRNRLLPTWLIERGVRLAGGGTR